MLKYNLRIFFVILILLSFCLTSNLKANEDQSLSLWYDTEVKQEIIDFVQMISDRNGADFIPIAKRNAVFDLDGTILCEKPMYIQGVISIHQLKAKADLDTTLRSRQPYKAAIQEDMKYLWHHPNEFMAAPFENETQTDYRNIVMNFLQTNTHLDLHLKYIDLFYLPMLQLIQYLHLNDFTVWICSGSAQGFIRSFSEKKLGVAPENIIGSQIDLEFVNNDSVSVFRRKGGFAFVNNDKLKPINIQRQIGANPILVFGNSDGDIPMLELVNTNDLPHRIFVVNHDDPEREYEYYHKKLLAKSKNYKWNIINMKTDFKKIFEKFTQ